MLFKKNLFRMFKICEIKNAQTELNVDLSLK